MKSSRQFGYRFFLLAAMVAVCVGVQAKEIQGRVIDKEGSAVHGASVVVMSLPDSVFISTSVTTEAGEVRFDIGEADTVLVTVQILGYERCQMSVGGDFTACLEATTTQLQEVVVEAKPEFRSEAGMLVFTPGDLVKRVNNAQDILQYVPMVRIGNGEISVLGSPQTIVYVNGKPPRGMYADIKSLIKSLPPSCIKRIEVIQNPGASVSGSYNGAIVNIVMTYPWEGFVGIVDAMAYFKPEMVTPTGSLSLYYTKDKWRFGYTGRFSSWGDDEKNEDYYEYVSEYPNGVKSYINDLHYRRWVSALMQSLTVNYNFTDRSTLGLGVRVGLFGTKQKNITTTTYTTLTGEEIERQSAVRDTLPFFATPSVGANLFYSLQTDDKGSLLDIVAGYYVKQSDTHTGMFYPEDTLFQNQSQYDVGWGGSAEYQHLFTKQVRLKVGAGYVANKQDDALDFYENSNRFIYTENMLSAFGEISFPWNRTSFVVGLRVESEFNSGDVRTTGESFERKSTAILPSVSFNWLMPWHNQSLSVSVSRNIKRPWMSELNPFRIWTSENAYTEGNPNLTNYYYLSSNINYMCVKNIMFNASFFKSFGSITVLTLPDEQGRMATTYYDVPGYYNISAGVTYSKELLSYLSLEGSAGYSYNYSKYECEGVKFKRIFSSVYVSVKSIFNFSKSYGIFGTVEYGLSSPFKGINDSRGAWNNSLVISLRKDWKNCSLSLYSLGWIPSHYKDRNFDSDVYIARFHKTNYSPTIVLSFRYVFGNRKVRTAWMRDAGVSNSLGQ